MKFRTKPVEVDAIKVDDVLRIEQEEDQEGWNALPEWYRKAGQRPGVHRNIVVTQDHIFIIVATGVTRQGGAGDWLVYQGGGIYVFTPDLFEQLYEPVE